MREPPVPGVELGGVLALLGLELLPQLLGAARCPDAIKELQVDLLPKLEHLHVVRSLVEL